MIDELTKHTLLAGLSDAEVAEVVGREMGKREMAGIMFFYSPVDARKHAVSFTLSDVTTGRQILDLPFHKQLYIFSLVAKEFGSISNTVLEEMSPEGAD